MAQPKKNNTGIALIAAEDAVYAPWTSNFGEDGMGYIKMMSHPNRYVTEARGEQYTSVEPEKNYIGSTTLPETTQDWLNYASGDVQSLVNAAIAEQRQAAIPIEVLGVINAPIVKIGVTPGLNEVEVDKESNWDRMSNKDRRKANRQINKYERELNRFVRRDSRTEQAIAKKFGSDYNPANRESSNQFIERERERIKLMRKLING